MLTREAGNEGEKAGSVKERAEWGVGSSQIRTWRGENEKTGEEENGRWLEEERLDRADSNSY